MDITASNGHFYVGMIRYNFETKWNKDNTLSVWSVGKTIPIHVTTGHGDFIEVINKAGEVIQTGGDRDWFYVQTSKEPIKLRFKKLPKPELSKTQIDKARKKTTVTVVKQERYDGGPFDFGASYTDGTLKKVMKSLEKIATSIPKEYLDKARCEINSESGYEDSHYASIEVSYERPETDAEVIERLQIDVERKRINEDKEKQQFKNLKKKYCPVGTS